MYLVLHETQENGASHKGHQNKTRSDGKSEHCSTQACLDLWFSLCFDPCFMPVPTSSMAWYCTNFPVT